MTMHKNIEKESGMQVSSRVLEQVCRKKIEVILFCLPNAFRGTVYTVGPLPDLRVVRMVSGYRNGRTDDIRWEEKQHSAYDCPGKVWDDYGDRPGRTLEAMAWCVERQESWTVDNPESNHRSVRKQFEGTTREDYHHMEPVLVRKTDVSDEMWPSSTFPIGNLGKPIWHGSSLATVAVVKIDFTPGAIGRGDRSTRVIKELSQSLGTEILSLHVTEITSKRKKRLAEERLAAYNTLAHEFRNILARLGFAYSAINNEIAYVRESWENLIYEKLPEQLNKRLILQRLNQLLQDLLRKNGYPDESNEINRLLRYQEQLMESCLLPQQNEAWLSQKIRPLWLSILSKSDSAQTIKTEIEETLEQLRRSFYVGQDKKLRDNIEVIPQELRTKWVDLAYREISKSTIGMTEQYIDLLDNISLKLPRKTCSLKNFVFLKGLIELIPEMEKRVNQHFETLKSV
ncbi:MAG: hypothetical protein JSU72_05790 [Deltaproteobacteria bacterium]|nr:MAG: hypothetical protein JSU72_05790 [Deltaproteobacteria bacterium]